MLVDMIILTIMGKLPPEGIWNTIGLISALFFFLLLDSHFQILPAREKKVYKG